MIHDIKQFGADLRSNYSQDSEVQSPPLTYEAYNAALKRHLYEFNNKVINIERDVMRQGIKLLCAIHEIVTFIIVLTALIPLRKNISFFRGFQYISIFVGWSEKIFKYYKDTS